MLSHLKCRWGARVVVIARTRHKHIPVGSVATFLTLCQFERSRSCASCARGIPFILNITVLAITNHPGSGHAGDFPNG